MAGDITKEMLQYLNGMDPQTMRAFLDRVKAEAQQAQQPTAEQRNKQERERINQSWKANMYDRQKQQFMFEVLRPMVEANKPLDFMVLRAHGSKYGITDRVEIEQMANQVTAMVFDERNRPPAAPAAPGGDDDGEAY